MEARIIKVASGGLDDSFLWTNVAGPGARGRLARAMRRFGAAETGAVIGEGGEFETLVLDGPRSLFRKRIVVDEADRRVVREGGGSAWLSLRDARLEEKGEEAGEGTVRIPDLLEPKFVGVLDTLSSPETDDFPVCRSRLDSKDEGCPPLGSPQASASEKLQQWSFVGGKSSSIEAKTRAIVEQIRQQLRQHSLPPSAIINATVSLRRMADFPAVNSIYGTLFDAPNPPSRVTISCGDALSAAADADIAVYLTVHTALQPAQRQGLHVQSRSYWAPANIGPYSQAISIPVSSLASNSTNNNSDAGATTASSGPRLVSIAGQIPLVPSTMALPSGSSGGQNTLPLQLTLSLQHLWRIGVEMGVQWWTSAVAFFPACRDDGQIEMAGKAKLASRTWRAAHVAKTAGGDDGEEEDETGPDLWDRRYNPEYMTFASGSGGDGGKAEPALPDRDVLVSSSEVSPPKVPPVFVAEVEELPRAAGVEWHAHWGVAQAGEGSVALRELWLPLEGDGKGGKAVVSLVVVGDGGEKGVRFVQTIVAEWYAGGWNGMGGCNRVAKTALEQLSGVGSVGELTAVVRYLDAGLLSEGGERTGGEGLGPVVPCRSLWDGQGQRLAAVTVYQSVFEERR
jgi:diphthine-ammonia ligase